MENNMEKRQKETAGAVERQKRYGLLIAGVILLAAGIAFSVYAYNTSYQNSLALGSQLSEAKARLAAVKEGSQTGDQNALNTLISQLSGEKLQQERPYSYGLISVFFALLLTIKGIYNAAAGKPIGQKADISRIAQAGLLAALCYIGFAFFKIDIPAGTEKASFHFGNVFCVLAALLLGGYWGGLDRKSVV